MKQKTDLHLFWYDPEPQIMLELKDRTYYKKPSAEKREKKALQKIRHKYKSIKEDKFY